MESEGDRRAVQTRDLVGPPVIANEATVERIAAVLVEGRMVGFAVDGERTVLDTVRVTSDLGAEVGVGHVCAVVRLVVKA